MRMLSIVSMVAVSIAAAAVAPANAEESSSFKHDGYTYVYKTTQDGEARTITGRRYPGGTAFSLRVKNGAVSGVSNGVPVAFDVSSAAGAAAGAKPAELSMR